MRYRALLISSTSPHNGTYTGLNTSNAVANHPTIEEAQASGERYLKQLSGHSVDLYILDVLERKIVAFSQYNPLPVLTWKRLD